MMLTRIGFGELTGCAEVNLRQWMGLRIVNLKLNQRIDLRRFECCAISRVMRSAASCSYLVVSLLSVSKYCIRSSRFDQNHFSASHESDTETSLIIYNSLT
jgi:hypothetical protein